MPTSDAMASPAPLLYERVTGRPGRRTRRSGRPQACIAVAVILRNDSIPCPSVRKRLAQANVIEDFWSRRPSPDCFGPCCRPASLEHSTSPRTPTSKSIPSTARRITNSIKGKAGRSGACRACVFYAGRTFGLGLSMPRRNVTSTYTIRRRWHACPAELAAVQSSAAFRRRNETEASLAWVRGVGERHAVAAALLDGSACPASHTCWRSLSNRRAV